MRIEVRKGEILKNGSEPIGNRVRCKVVKNKVAPPFKEAEFDMIYGKGISRIGEVVDIATELDIIHKSGAWFSYGDSKIAQGRDNTKEYLLNHPEMLAEVEEKIYRHRDEVAAASESSRKEAELRAAAEAAANQPAASASEKPASVVVETDDDFEEFTPV